ncbi:MAG: 4-hydroxy-tetrahydrodipicolinate synthase [Verrucomicrobia bacterium]|nr:4-hydroxy-tetrahydrodipicolinate synthase [Verrucomicrobiota bacterium]MBV9658107.1 4-hydroxy-tetrahydrodipicolinate synthase [Verrucomicrobiota bacterium]
MFRGTYTALVTPFTHGQLDEDALAAHVERQIAAGVDGVCPVGTTGESPTVTHAEHVRAVEIAVATARGRCQVIAGAGSNSTAHALELLHAVEEAGADGALIVTPYYNKPSQEGLFRHFWTLALATKLPIVLYSVPARCVVEIGVETAARLARECANIVAIKEAGGNVDRVSQLRAALPAGFPILCGCDELNLPMLAAGADGVVSVASNLIPQEIGDLVRAFARGKHDLAQHLHAKYYALCKDLFIDPNPVPVKTAMLLAGLLPSDEVRLPLVPMSKENLARLKATLAAADLLPG